MSGPYAIVLLAVVLGIAAPRAAGAQEQPKQPPPPPTAENSPANPDRPAWKLVVDIAHDFAHLPSWETVRVVGIGGGLALAAHPVDRQVNAHLVGDAWVHGVFTPGKVIGYGATQVGVAAATYVWGRTHDEPKVVHLGVDLLRAQIVTQLVTLGIKEVVRRDRPDGGGLSFPSGHASVTFASATVLERHFGWRAAVPTYLVASYVAASRLHENRHYLSDVVFGAAVGIAGGRTVTRHGRNSWALSPGFVPGGAGVFVTRVGPD